MSVIRALCAYLLPLIFKRILVFHERTKTRARGSKTFFMLNSTEHEIFHAHKC